MGAGVEDFQLHPFSLSMEAKIVC